MNFTIALSTISTDNWQKKSSFSCLTNSLEYFQNRFAPSKNMIALFEHSGLDKKMFCLSYYGNLLFFLFEKNF